jgi:subtilisin family serine protease
MVRIGRFRLTRIVLVTTAALAIQASLTLGASAAPVKGAISGATRSYIVVLKPGVAPKAVASAHASQLGARITHVYQHALTGYSARLSTVALEVVRRDARVAYIEADGIIRAETTQNGATWGLDRIDQRNRPLSTTYNYTNTGSGVTAYIIDSGIRFSHQDFGGRAVSGVDTIDGGSADDCNSHGTHTAGTVGGTAYGVAKSVTLVAVRVLGCDGSGPTSGVIAGVDWVTGNHVSGPAVANMSLGGGTNSALDTAVRNSIADGITYTLSAGNGNVFGRGVSACNQSPARTADAITVSATNKSDAKPKWANYGNCVDIFAPGVAVVSDSNGSDTATATKDGTSMAAPHVAGVAAMYLQTHPSATPAQVWSAIFSLATKDIVANSKTADHNDLLYENPAGI